MTALLIISCWILACAVVLKLWGRLQDFVDPQPTFHSHKYKRDLLFSSANKVSQ